MTRDDLLASLSGRYGTLAAAASLLPVDDSANYGPALDESYAALFAATGLDAAAVDDLPQTDPHLSDLLALGRYATLSLIAERLAVAVDMSVNQNEVSKKRSQMFTQVTVLIERLAADLTQRGYGPNQFGSGRLQLDFLEPANAEFAVDWWA